MEAAQGSQEFQEVRALAASDFVLLVLAAIVVLWVVPCWIRRGLRRITSARGGSAPQGKSD